jgi:hypothetical protein
MHHREVQDLTVARFERIRREEHAHHERLKKSDSPELRKVARDQHERIANRLRPSSVRWTP